MTALPYYGGKSPLKSVSRWIASHLPIDSRAHYIEPFCGMCGLLLSRPAARLETINDRNGRLVNWWRVIRDYPEEFGRQLDWTPQDAKDEFVQAVADLDCTDPIRRAVAYTVVIRSGLTHADGNPHWGRFFSGNTRPRFDSRAVTLLRERLLMVRIENMDAVDLLESVADQDDAVIYCDPPYRTTSTEHYEKATPAPDWGKLAAALEKQRGRVAISGFAGEWDSLRLKGKPQGWPWKTASLSRTSNAINAGNDGHPSGQEKTEVLWMNYDPPQGLLSLD